MASFALVVLPAWAAFALSKSWKSALWLSLLIGVVSYFISFVVALSYDQAFAPVQVAVLFCLAVGLRLFKWRF
jgi:zinc/manganese transport system permease protein